MCIWVTKSTLFTWANNVFDQCKKENIKNVNEIKDFSFNGQLFIAPLWAHLYVNSIFCRMFFVIY